GALQVQIDSSVASIDRIANSTTFGGKQLLNGNLDFTFSAADPVNNFEVRDVQVHQVSLEAGDSMTVNYTDLVPTTEGRVTFNTNADAVDGLVVEVAGADGSMTFRFDPGTTAADMRSTIDASSDITGVQSNGNDLVSTGKGSDDFVRLNIVSGAGGGAEGYYEGTDGEVTVNGQKFVERDGVYHVNLPDLKLSMKVLNIAGDGNFTINGGGAVFQITGNVGVAGQVRIGIGSVTSSGLGDSFDGHLSDLVTGGSLSLVDGSELGDAAEVVEEAILKVATLRGRLGALQRNTLETNRNSLQVALENLVASESRIRDTDFARQTAELTRNRILAQASTSVLATANRTPSIVLSLLR
ncbi:MAG: flagellin, partial [Planctomycetota bacterium]